MRGKTDRKIRKAVNAVVRKEDKIADQIVLELLNAPFKYRFKFAMKLLFWRKK